MSLEPLLAMGAVNLNLMYWVVWPVMACRYLYWFSWKLATYLLLSQDSLVGMDLEEL